MKTLIFALFILLSANVSAGPYTDFGLGYIQSVPGKADSVLTTNGTVTAQLNEKGTVELDSPFLMFRLGYRWASTNMHLELNRFGLFNNDTTQITSWRGYKRFESDMGFYSDIGLGYVIDVPSKSKTRTETEGPVTMRLDQSATIDLDSPFPMIRLGYRWKSTNMHLEYERIGNLMQTNRSISTINVYKRWEWE